MISIAICSHDRSEDVACCLAALAPQLPNHADELVLVDSCSTPQHAAALRALSARYNAHLVRLETAGHSLARNAAVASARGEWVAFLDDDAVPFRDWLVSLHKVIDAGESDLAAVGGPTEPLWPISEPAPLHISNRWLFYLSCIQETVRRSVRQGAKVCGANLAFRKNTLLAIGGFRNELGRVGNRLTGGEETFAVKLLLRIGHEVIYDPSVKVQHRIHRERLTEAWINRRAYWEGVTEVAMVKATDDPFPWHLAVPKLAASAIVFRALYFITRNPDLLIRSQIAAGALTARFKSFETSPSPPKAMAHRRA